MSAYDDGRSAAERELATLAHTGDGRRLAARELLGALAFGDTTFDQGYRDALTTATSDVTLAYLEARIAFSWEAWTTMPDCTARDAFAQSIHQLEDQADALIRAGRIECPVCFGLVAPSARVPHHADATSRACLASGRVLR